VDQYEESIIWYINSEIDCSSENSAQESLNVVAGGHVALVHVHQQILISKVSFTCLCDCHYRRVANFGTGVITMSFWNGNHGESLETRMALRPLYSPPQRRQPLVIMFEAIVDLLDSVLGYVVSVGRRLNGEQTMVPSDTGMSLEEGKRDLCL